MFRTLLAKEFREQIRTNRLVIYLAVFLVSGLISPVLAKYTPQLLGAIPDLPKELVALIPPPELKDAIAQYVKNTSQFGVILVILMTMGGIAQEKERGTAAMLLTKPVRRSGMVLAKGLVGNASILSGILLGSMGCAIYTYVLFGEMPSPGFVYLNLLMLVFFSVYQAIALLASTLARSQSMAAVGAFGGMAALLILGAIPRAGEYLPGELLSWGESLSATGSVSAWPALWVSLGLILAAVGIACIAFEREEI